MKLKTVEYRPVAESIWVGWEPEEAGEGEVVATPGAPRMPPFVHVEVLAVGPKVMQVKKGDIVLVNAGTLTKMKVPGFDEQYFTMENKIVAVVEPIQPGIRLVEEK